MYGVMQHAVLILASGVLWYFVAKVAASIAKRGRPNGIAWVPGRVAVDLVMLAVAASWSSVVVDELFGTQFNGGPSLVQFSSLAAFRGMDWRGWTDTVIYLGSQVMWVYAASYYFGRDLWRLYTKPER